jgi:hypothetical protein
VIIALVYLLGMLIFDWKIDLWGVLAAVGVGLLIALLFRWHSQQPKFNERKQMWLAIYIIGAIILAGIPLITALF